MIPEGQHRLGNAPLIEIPPPKRVVRRHLPARELPPYRFVPGLHPHPTRDSRGHSFGVEVGRRARWSASDWHRLPEWLYGVDLYNAFYFWEAHEAWEALWAVHPRGSVPALLLQGLIQVTAALLKIHLGALDGAARLSSEGLDKLRRVARAAPRLLGLDVAETTQQLERYFRPLHERTLPPLDSTVPVLELSTEATREGTR